MLDEENETPVQRPRQKNGNSVIYIVILIVLVLTGAYFMTKNHNTSQIVTSQTQTINTDSLHIADLDAKYHAEMDSLYSFKGHNATLDSLLNKRIAQLKEMERNLAVARRNGKLAADKYQSSIDTLNTIVGDLKNQIADLQSKNHVLMIKNDSLGSSITTSVNNNHQLAQQHTTLNTKLTKASLLIPQNFISQAIKVSSSGKEKATTNDKKAKRVKISFDVPADENIDAGNKTFYMVLKDPQGTVLTDKSQNSGAFKMGEDTTQNQQYTLSKTVPYNMKQLHVDMEWTSPSGFEEGYYTAQVYQDGYLTGTGTLRLK